MDSDYNLFSLETNSEPELMALENCDALENIFKTYGLSKVSRVSELHKGNPLSHIYLVDTENESYVLRSIESEINVELEKQCDVVSNLSDGLSIRPLRNNGNSYVASIDGKQWICYPMIAGRQFNGNVSHLSLILRKAIQLGNELHEIHLKDETTKNLRKINYEPEKWSQILVWLNDTPINSEHEKLQDILPLALKEMIINAAYTIHKCIDQSCKLPINYTLVHYDLQHANVLISDSDSITFIDLEDIYLSDNRLSIYHGIFKWVRHSIYCNKSNSHAAIAWLKNDCLEILREELDESQSLDDIYNYGIYRTLSDIYNLIEAVINSGKVEYLYDLEKKLSNMLEIFSIFSIEDVKNKNVH